MGFNPQVQYYEFYTTQKAQQIFIHRELLKITVNTWSVTMFSHLIFTIFQTKIEYQSKELFVA